MKVTGPRVRSRVAGVAVALALAGGGTAALAAGSATHSAAEPTARHNAVLAVEAHTSLLRYLSKNKGWNIPVPGGGPHGVTPSTVNAGAGLHGATAESFNWSGYADTTTKVGAFTAVSGSWVEPVATCTSEQRLTAFWVGLDGYSNMTVEQDGTLAYCFEGDPYYFSWWEMYPGGSVTVGSQVRPGDMITASVTRSGTSYTLSVSDPVHPQNSFSTVQTCPATTCEDQSAEWIAERPAFSIGITPLATFANWTLSNGSQTVNGVKGSIASGPNSTGIEIIDATETYPLDSVSGLTGGTSFTAHWLNSY
jgi:peptidase A4-like protein